MAMVKEFKEFAMKGSVVDLAVGVIIGGAFGKIVSVLVEKVLMPPLGLLIGGMDFSQLRWILKAAGADGKGEVAVGYGELIQTIINFLIIAWALFIVIRTMNGMKRQAPPVPVVAVAPPEDLLVLREIRDLLRK
jgi:large conductance mechanosensitive channel